MTRISVTDEQIHAAQGGDSDAMWDVISAFDPMVNGLIRSVAPGASREVAEDLLQEARALLIQHVRDYRSESSSAALSSYVYQAVRRLLQETHLSMTTTLTVDAGSALRVKRALWEAGGDVERAWLALSQTEDPRNRMTRERFMAVLEALASTERLDAPTGGGDEGAEGLTLSDVIADPTATLTDSVERRDYARWLMTQVPPRQSLALRAFYGVSMTKQPDAQTADDMGIKLAALRRLRANGCESARRVSDVHAWLRSQAPVTLAEAA